MVAIRFDPYERVDWERFEAYSTDFHVHCWKTDSSEAEIIDFFTGEVAPTPRDDERTGYEYYGYSADGHGSSFHESAPDVGGELYWPWEGPSDRTLHRACDPEPRDPSELGVVAYPARELVGSLEEMHEHVHDLFGENYPTPPDGGAPIDRREAIEAILERDGTAIVAHPHEYRSGGSDDPTAYADSFGGFTRTDRFSGTDGDPTEYDEFAAYSLEDGLLGFEVIGLKGHFFDGWDSALAHFLPDARETILGFAASDLQHGLSVGDEVMRFETAVVVDPDDVDPDDQDRSRDRIREAFYDGRTLSIVRSPWDDESRESPAVPTIDSIETGDRTVTIEARGHDEIRWISSGEVVTTGSEITLTADHAPYVRAELESSDGALVATQPWTVVSP